MAGAGRFVLVVGPSGAGKDTLIAGARTQLSEDARFVFPQRLITRTMLPEAEVHGTISRADFERRLATGDHALAWQAHGLGYVIPRSAADAVMGGRIAVCNGSRQIVADALERYPGTHVILVDATRSQRAARLAARGRESAADIETRLARETPGLPECIPLTRIDNSGPIQQGLNKFISALIAISG